MFPCAVTDATSIGVWFAILVALGVGLFVAFGVFAFLVPYTRRKALGKFSHKAVVSDSKLSRHINIVYSRQHSASDIQNSSIRLVLLYIVTVLTK